VVGIMVSCCHQSVSHAWTRSSFMSVTAFVVKHFVKQSFSQATAGCYRC
jgi:hypothetical protein